MDVEINGNLSERERGSEEENSRHTHNNKAQHDTTQTAGKLSKYRVVK